MGKLHYVTNTSLDLFIEDGHGSFTFSEPDDEQFAFITELVRAIGTWLYGRRLYEAMALWETDPALATASPLTAEFAAVWQSGAKVVYSSTLDEVATNHTRIERTFDVDAVRALKDAADRDLTVGGAALAAHAFRAGLVDELHLFVAPVLLGGGKPGLPGDLHLDLDLRDQRRFPTGIVYLHYGVRA